MGKHRFKAAVSQLLARITHSLSSPREIFLRELISNASDALDKLRFESLTQSDLMPEGESLGIVLDVDADSKTLTLADNGIGMTEEEADRACEPFVTTTAVGKGTGLGLSMVYGFAQQAGGFF